MPEVDVGFEMSRKKVGNYPAYSLNFHVKIRRESGLEKIGTARGFWVPFFHDAHDLVYDTLDMIDGELYQRGCQSLLFSDLSKNQVSGWVTVQYLQLEEEYRGFGYGREAMKEILMPFMQPHTLAVIRPGAIIKRGSEPDRELVEKGLQSLRNYWHDFGFRRLGDSPFYAHNATYEWPSGSWMEGNL